MTTDTPRTDDRIFEVRTNTPVPMEVAPASYARQLERELNKAEAEVERLNGLLSDLLILTEKIYWNSNNYKMIKEAHRDCK